MDGLDNGCGWFKNYSSSNYTSGEKGQRLFRASISNEGKFRRRLGRYQVYSFFSSLSLYPSPSVPRESSFVSLD